MSDAPNPYQPPASPVASAEAALPLELTGAGRRFLSFLLDYLGFLAASVVAGLLLGITLALTAGPESARRILAHDTLLGMGVYVLYYFAFESALGWTPGKLALGLRVVDARGLKPAPARVLGRTFARFFPFDAFTFFGDKSRGWHDQASGTYVVRRPPR